MNSIKFLSALVCSMVVIGGCSREAPPEPVMPKPVIDNALPITVYSGGPIITVDDQQPEAESVAVQDGLIVAVGPEAAVLAAVGADAKRVDLGGNTLVPGLIDAHGHITFTAMNMASVNLSSPPVGPAETVDDIVKILSGRLGDASASGWLTGWGYDDSLLADKRHPTREDLDQVSTDVPIVLRHVSGHLTSCNSKCLEMAGIDKDTPDPKGGIIRRDASGRPDGVLEETAMWMVFALLPPVTPEQLLALLGPTQDYYAKHGITTVQDGALGPNELAILRRAAAEQLLYLDVNAFPYVQVEADMGADVDNASPDYGYGTNYDNRLRVAGIKLVLDGSPQGKTAWMTKPYLHPPHGQGEDYVGYPTLEDEEVVNYITDAYKEGVPVQAHANGDAAADQLINAVRAANDLVGAEKRRTVMIHAQTLREDQQDAMHELGMIPSYFSAHTFYWGDWHRDSVFGVERASRISPLKTSVDRGMVFTTHNDTPIVPPDMMRLLWASVNRVTRSGKVLGEAQRIDPLNALKSITIHAAYQYFEEDSKGSIEVGKRADLTILSANPLAVERMSIKDITVLETIKDGTTVYTSGWR